MNAIFYNGLFGFDRLSRSIGPYKIAHWLRKHGYTAQVIEFVNCLDEETLYTLTKKFITSETKIIGFSTTFMIWEKYIHSDGNEYRYPEHILKVLRRIKEEHPTIKIVTGGYQSDTLPSYGIIDASIMAYKTASEEVFLEYLEHLIYGRPPPPSKRSFWDPRPVFNQSSKNIYNIELDDFKFIKQDCILPNEPLPLDVSRGCIFACKFCQYQHIGKKKYDYVRNMSYLEEELLHNYNEFGTTNYLLLDDTFNDTQIKLEEFHAMVNRLPFKINFVSYLRCDLIHRFPDTAHILKESGLFGAHFGIETLHPEASNLIGKAWSGKYAREFVPELYHNIWKKEVPVHTNFIVGLTHDTEENVFDTIKWFMDNKLHSMAFEGLGIYGRKAKPGYEIESEFDKNPSKYGYTVLEPIGNDRFPDWTTNNWTRSQALTIAEKANTIISPVKKTGTWQIPGLLWYGASKNEIINFTLGQYRNIKHRLLTTDDLIKQYVQLLLEVK